VRSLPDRFGPQTLISTAHSSSTVKKAIADAYDLAQAGETRPYMLMMSHPMTGLLAQMITRARRAGVINDVQIIGAYSDDDEDDDEDDDPSGFDGRCAG
jgi:hypothetical protein